MTKHQNKKQFFITLFLLHIKNSQNAVFLAPARDAYDRVSGGFVGHHLGDALGLLVINEKYGNKIDSIFEFCKNVGYKQRLLHTDITEDLLALSEALCVDNHFWGESVASNLVSHFFQLSEVHRIHREHLKGVYTFLAAREYNLPSTVFGRRAKKKELGEERACGWYEGACRAHNQNALIGNSCLARVAATVAFSSSIEEAIVLSLLQCAVTHVSPEVLSSAVILSITYWHLLHDDEFITSVIIDTLTSYILDKNIPPNLLDLLHDKVGHCAPLYHLLRHVISEEPPEPSVRLVKSLASFFGKTENERTDLFEQFPFEVEDRVPQDIIDFVLLKFGFDFSNGGFSAKETVGVSVFTLLYVFTFETTPPLAYTRILILSMSLCKKEFYQCVGDSSTLGSVTLAGAGFLLGRRELESFMNNLYMNNNWHQARTVKGAHILNVAACLTDRMSVYVCV